MNTLKRTDDRLLYASLFYETEFVSIKSHQLPCAGMAIPPWLQEHCQRLTANDVQLQNLNLNIRRLDLEWCEALAQATKGNTQLRVLNLVSSILETDAEVAIVRALPETQLETIHLSYNSITTTGAVSLGKVLQNPQVTLKELYLDYNCISDDGAVSLAQGIVTNRVLVAIHLNCNEVGDKGAVAFGDSLKKNSSLTRLHLNCNRITSHGALALFDALHTNMSLMELSLVRNDMSQQLEGRIECMVRANRSGRHLLREAECLPVGIWSHVLAHAKNDPDTIFYFLLELPNLFQSR